MCLKPTASNTKSLKNSQKILATTWENHKKMTMTMTKIKKPFLILAIAFLSSLLLLMDSVALYANFSVAMFTSMAIVMGSLYSYRNMIQSRIGDADVEDTKDAIDMMDDPYDLYEEERESEITDIKIGRAS